MQTVYKKPVSHLVIAALQYSSLLCCLNRIRDNFPHHRLGPHPINQLRAEAKSIEVVLGERGVFNSQPLEARNYTVA